MKSEIGTCKTSVEHEPLTPGDRRWWTVNQVVMWVGELVAPCFPYAKDWISDIHGELARMADAGESTDAIRNAGSRMVMEGILQQLSGYRNWRAIVEPRQIQRCLRKFRKHKGLRMVFGEYWDVFEDVITEVLQPYDS